MRHRNACSLAALLMLTGCHVRLPIEEARAEGVELAQVRNDAAAGTPIDAPGPWTEINLKVPKVTLRKIAWWQLHFTVHVIDCSTGALRDIAWTKVHGISAIHFAELRRLIRETPGEQDYWLVGYVRHSPPGSCAKLDGGSYTLQSISSDIVPIKFE